MAKTTAKTTKKQQTDLPAPVATTEDGKIIPVVESAQDFDPDQWEVADVELLAEYWTPEDVGEAKIVMFDRYGTRTFEDEDTGEEYDLEVAFLREPKKVDGQLHWSHICNGGIRLLSGLKELGVQHGSFFQITYEGRKKNSTNSNTSDFWSIKPLKRKS